MPLLNSRSTRNLHDLPQAVRNILTRYNLGAFGNFAVLICRPAAGVALQGDLDGKLGLFGAVLHVDHGEGVYAILARNTPRFMHSEIVAIRLFERHLRRIGAIVTYVFSEREPCHEGAHNCSEALDRLFAAYGDRGAQTPVRYLSDYFNRAEASTMATMGRMRREEVMEQNRRQARRDILARRRGM